METARICVESGRQTVRLPESCGFQDDEVLVNRIGEIVMLVPKGSSLAGMIGSLDMFTEDFMNGGRNDLQLQERDLL